MKLTHIEKQMYEVLSTNEIATREALATAKPAPALRTSNVVDVHMKNLRVKLKAEGMEVRTIRGIGYQLVKPS